jgi:hypothetical protein
MLQSTIPRRIVIASGADDSLVPRLRATLSRDLARDGVTLDERKTGGAAENARLIADAKSGVDVAFMHGGVIKEPGNVGNAGVAVLRAAVGLLPRDCERSRSSTSCATSGSRPATSTQGVGLRRAAPARRTT